jgi:ornithine cyclodeaminase/alanine dehydrogenase-like protein (mu-crystallin family)
MGHDQAYEERGDHMTDQHDGILYLSRNDVEQALASINSLDVIQEVFKMHGSGQTTLPDEAYLPWRNTEGDSLRSLNMPAFLGGDIQVAGTKIINSNPANPQKGLPRASGLTLLFDVQTARVVCVMEAAYISCMRTASVTALSARLFTGYPIECVALIGAGVLAWAHIHVLTRFLPHVKAIQLFDINEERVMDLHRQVEPLLRARGICLQHAVSAEAAIRSAQLVVPVTTTTTGYIQFDWLQKGAILVNVSLDDALPEVVFQADQRVVDDWQLVKNDPHRLMGRMYRAHQLVGPSEALASTSERCCRVDAELGDIVTGRKPGRAHRDEIILINPFGLAIEDIAFAHRVYRFALDRKLGTLLTP